MSHRVFTDHITFNQGVLPDLGYLYAVDCPDIVDLYAMMVFTYNILPVIAVVSDVYMAEALRAACPSMVMTLQKAFRLKCRSDEANKTILAAYLALQAKATAAFNGVNSTLEASILADDPRLHVFNASVIVNAIHATYVGVFHMLHGI
jgi:hypothetical protein